jgi:hypothetical protein
MQEASKLRAFNLKRSLSVDSMGAASECVQQLVDTAKELMVKYLFKVYLPCLQLPLKVLHLWQCCSACQFLAKALTVVK